MYNQLAEMLANLKARILKTCFDLLYSSLRVKIIDQENVLGRAKQKELKVIFAMFHHSYFIPFYINRHNDYAVFTAKSRAGDILTKLLKPAGYTVFRFPPDNDPKAAARATIELITALKRGNQAALTVDGPLGPNEKVKPGIFMIAGKSGATIYPAGIGMQRSVTMHYRWDKFRLPLPFSKVVAICGESFTWSGSLDANDLKKECSELEHALKKLTEKAELIAKEKDTVQISTIETASQVNNS